MTELVNDVVSRCPTKAIMLKETKDVSAGPKISSVALNDTQSLEINNADCVRCMHCINVMTGALAPGKDKGATILVGGQRTGQAAQRVHRAACQCRDCIGVGQTARHRRLHGEKCKKQAR